MKVLKWLRPGLGGALLLLSLAGCSVFPAPAGFQAVETAGFEGVIVPAAEAEAFLLAFYGAGASGYWTPGREDVLQLEERLPAFLQTSPDPRSPDLWQKLARYKRQYVGVIENGTRKIFVSAFCDTMGVDWKREPVAVADGGDCFFEVQYEPDSGAFVDLYVHGES